MNFNNSHKPIFIEAPHSAFRKKAKEKKELQKKKGLELPHITESKEKIEDICGQLQFSNTVDNYKCAKFSVISYHGIPTLTDNKEILSFASDTSKKLCSEGDFMTIDYPWKGRDVRCTVVKDGVSEENNRVCPRAIFYNSVHKIDYIDVFQMMEEVHRVLLRHVKPMMKLHSWEYGHPPVKDQVLEFYTEVVRRKVTAEKDDADLFDILDWECEIQPTVDGILTMLIEKNSDEETIGQWKELLTLVEDHMKKEGLNVIAESQKELQNWNQDNIELKGL